MENIRVSLLPLLPFTQGGTRHEVIELMISYSQQAKRKDLLLMGFASAALVMEQEDQQWLKEKFMDLNEKFEETWVYQDIAREGSLRELRNMLVRLTTLRFPDLASQAQEQSEQTESQEQLRTMIDQLVTATTVQEAQTALAS